MLKERNINIVFVDLPYRVKGFCVQHSDGQTVCLNSRFANDANLQTYLHEISHINNDDFYSEANVDELEYLRHRC